MKNVLVTGASGGIGEATARAFASEGYNVALHGFSNFEKVTEMAKELSLQNNIKTYAVKCDISKSDEVCAMFDELDKNFGKIDILVNNAGVSFFMMLCDTTETQWENVQNINLKGAFLCTKEAIKNMVHNKWGRIINVTSVWANKGSACEIAYSSAKAGLIGFTKATARELAMSGITVNSVSPGLIDTPMNDFLNDEDIEELCKQIPVGRMGKPSEVASLIVYLASENAAYITAQDFAVDGGWV